MWPGSGRFAIHARAKDSKSRVRWLGRISRREYDPIAATKDWGVDIGRTGLPWELRYYMDHVWTPPLDEDTPTSRLTQMLKYTGTDSRGIIRRAVRVPMTPECEAYLNMSADLRRQPVSRIINDPRLQFVSDWRQ